MISTDMYNGIIPPVYLQYQPWGRHLLELSPYMRWGLTQPHSKYFDIFNQAKPGQNDKAGPEILLTAAHATSLTKEP